MKKFKKHTPFHLYLDDEIYFITARTLDNIKHFNSTAKLQMLLECVDKAVSKYNIHLYAYVVLHNHYHLLMKLPEGKELENFIRYIHGKSGKLIKNWKIKPSGLDHKRIWWNYWDNCIRDEKTFFTKINYVHHNPVKHGYVKKMENYKYSCYNNYINKYESEFVDDMFEQYPIVDFTDPNDDFNSNT